MKANRLFLISLWRAASRCGLSWRQCLGAILGLGGTGLECLPYFGIHSEQEALGVVWGVSTGNNVPFDVLQWTLLTASWSPVTIPISLKTPTSLSKEWLGDAIVLASYGHLSNLVFKIIFFGTIRYKKYLWLKFFIKREQILACLLNSENEPGRPLSWCHAW